MISLPKLVVVGLSMVTCVYSSNGTNITETQILSEDRSFSVGSALRIQPLGDSITWGQGSSDGNGYRYKLLRLLAGNDITYIGSERSGSMANSNNEGHPGALISEMSLHALKSLHLQPNVILVLAGTNDIYKDVDPATAPARLGSLIDNLITMSPHAAILVAQIPPMNDTSRNAVAQTFNAAIPGIVASRAGSGAKVLAVERDPRFSTRYLADGLHPDDMGHGLLADMFSAGIQRAAEAGWISEPVPLPTSNRTVCDTFLTWDPKFGTIAIGVGSADSAFVSSWQPAGRLAIGHVGPPKTWWGEELPQGKWVRLADMDGDGRDDYLWVHPNTGAAILYLNGGYSVEGGVNWISKGEIATGIGEAAGVMFADINGDGRDDFLWISPGGLVTAYINGGEKEGGGWLWTSVGQIAGEGTGATRETTRFADIDGDGRADYMVVGAEGSLNAWLNVGYGDKPDWTPLGIIATGIGDAAGVQLFDLNNDGRADYIWLDKDGAAKAYINNRGSGGLAPDWINAGSIATGVGAKREELRFADLNGDGKKDYVWVDRVSGALDVWFNTATGGSYVVGDGTVFADMDGDGFEDYLAISPNGAIELWLNHGHDPTSLKWIWDGQGQIATGVAARKDIRVADLDGDGLADYLVVDENSGAVVFWRNGGRQNDGSWSWTNMGQVATGVGDGPGVRFADINGDGKADYLWVAKDGSVKAYLNGGSGSNGWVWESRGVIAKGVGAPRQDIKFADINGDGLADYLWVNRLDGSVSEWQRNGGMRDEWQWIPQGQIAAGVGANGLTVQFASLSGSGRADYLKVDPATGAVTMWANACFGGGSAGTGWLAATCNDPGVNDASISPPERWNAVDTSNGWLAAIAYWRANQSPDDLSFPRRINNFFNGPENMDCGLTADQNGCSNTVQCHDVNHPAAMFILNSFVQINRMNMNFYSALHRAHTGISSLMASFSKSFAPIKETSAIDKLVLDFVGLGFSLVAGPAWNIGLKSFTYFAKNANNAATLKDMTNGLVMNCLAIAKDSIPGNGVKLDNNESLEVAMANLVKHWAESVAAANKQMFDGSPESIQQLTSMITDGHVLGDSKGSAEKPIEDLGIQKLVQQAIFASLIPRAWGLSNEGFRPVILNSGKPCDSGNGVKEYVTDETAAKTFVCHEEQLYYFVSATGDYRRCGATPGGSISCAFSKFKPLSGMEALDAGTFGELTKTDLVIGALAGYKANGNRNGWPAADPGQASTNSDIYDATIQGAAIRSPGVVMIPICSPELAVANWNDMDTGALGFPCQPQTREKRRAVARKRQ